MKPLIGIPARALIAGTDPWLPQGQGVFNSYVNAIINAGGVPLMIPLVDNREALHTYSDLADAFLFAGGGDITPQRYHQQAKYPVRRQNKLQDKNELILGSWAVLEQKPIIGICRGMQLMNVAMGGSLHQDLQGDGVTEFDHNSSETHRDFTFPVHDIELATNSHLAEIVGETEFTVNSLHHQGIDRLADDLRATAWAPDGVIEAAEGRHHPYLLLTQFHPELLILERDRSWEHLFEDFVAHAAMYAQARRKTKAHF